MVVFSFSFGVILNDVWSDVKFQTQSLYPPRKLHERMIASDGCKMKLTRYVTLSVVVFSNDRLYYIVHRTQPTTLFTRYQVIFIVGSVFNLCNDRGRESSFLYN